MQNWTDELSSFLRNLYLKENKNSHSSYFQNSIGYQKSNFSYSENRKKVTNGDDFPIDILHLESTTKVSFDLFITL